jgi:hypothetical protein
VFVGITDEANQVSIGTSKLFRPWRMGEIKKKNGRDEERVRAEGVYRSKELGKQEWETRGRVQKR